MIEVGKLSARETEFLGQAHAQQAASQRMAGNRALGKVEREGKSGNDRRQGRIDSIRRGLMDCRDLPLDSSHWLLLRYRPEIPRGTPTSNRRFVATLLS